jgi:hypothetical protein
MFFFGTPFDGTKLANFASPIVKFLRGNNAIIESLKVRSTELRAIVEKFNQLRSNPETRIPLMITYEMRPMFKTQFVGFIRFHPYFVTVVSNDTDLFCR